MRLGEEKSDLGAKRLALGVIERGIAHDAETLACALGVMPETARSLIRELEGCGALAGSPWRPRPPGRGSKAARPPRVGS